jgi:hypothetical protein
LNARAFGQSVRAAPPETRRGFGALDLALLGLLLVLAFALRLRVGIDSTYIVHPDETFDYLEQGFRLVFGYGSFTWTYQHGLRSYVFPAILAGLFKLGVLLDLRPGAQLNMIAGFMSLLSLSIVACAFVWGHRVASTLGALLAGFLGATWFELVHFAPKTLQEVLATNVLVIAACLCPDRLPRRPGGADGTPMSRRRLVWLAICLGLTAALRVQLAPAALVIGLWMLWHDPRRALLLVLPISALPVLAFGLLDWATYSYPFQSFILNVWANTAGGVSAYYSRQPFYALLNVQAHYQGGGAFVAIGLLALAGAFRLPLPALIAASVYGAHALIGHKEYRFIYPAMPLVMVLAGIGTAMLVDLVRRQLPRLVTPALVGGALAAWGFVSLHAATDGPFRREWHRASGMIEAARHIAARPQVCGVGGYGIAWSALPGYVRLRHDVPMHIVSTPARFAEDAVSFDVVIAPDDNLPPEGIFTLSRCWDNGWNEASQNQRRPRICVLERSGPCRPGAINDVDRDRPPGW